MIESPLQALYRRLFKPSFWQIRTAARRALPDFLVIGAMRCGTTSLYDFLSRHPAVAPAIKKEVHFFDLDFDRGAAWYRAHFPYRSMLKESGLLTGEASPYYLTHPLAPERARELLPDVKLIAVLRNPVDRAYSHYWHSVRLNVEPLSFENALAAEPDRLEGEQERLRTVPGARSRSLQHHAYATRSLYGQELGRWLAQFPREQLLVLEQGEMNRDPEGQTVRLFAFLDLAPLPIEMRSRLNKAVYPPMNPAARQKLLSFFASPNRQLFDLIGETFDWEN